jgi:hypothetical protein
LIGALSIQSNQCIDSTDKEPLKPSILEQSETKDKKEYKIVKQRDKGLCLNMKFPEFCKSGAFYVGRANCTPPFERRGEVLTFLRPRRFGTIGGKT